jgi:hypothetical protein
MATSGETKVSGKCHIKIVFKPIIFFVKGWLYKWTNFLLGYQKRWFVLSNGELVYFRSQEEIPNTCRGTIALQGAYIQSKDRFKFIVTNEDGTETFNLRASSGTRRIKTNSIVLLY